MTKLRIKKIEELPDAEYPNNIKIGYEKESEIDMEFFSPPMIGECFFAGNLRTSTVQSIIDDHTFKTVNSIYEWNIINF